MIEGIKIVDAIKYNPNLKKYVVNNKIDFKNKEALIEYNKAVLKGLFNIDMDFSKEHLTPPAIGRYLFVKSSFDTLNKLNIKNPKVLEVGGGSGIISILIKKLYNSEVYATEVDKDLINLFKRNLEKNNLNVKIIYSNGKILRGIKEIENKKFNLIISYPPYYSSNSIPSGRKFGGALAKIHELVGGGKFGEKFSLKLIEESVDFIDKGILSIMLPKKPERRREIVINHMKDFYDDVLIDMITTGKRIRFIIKGVKY